MPSSSKVSYLPKGYSTIIPYLIIKDAVKALEFYKKIFGATEQTRFEMPGGKIGHVELRIGDSLIMLADEFPEMGARSPQTLGGSPVSLTLYVENVDDVIERAVAAGAKIEHPIENKFYGDRMGSIIDPFGHSWSIGTHIEDVSPEEMHRREATMRAKHA